MRTSQKTCNSFFQRDALKLKILAFICISAAIAISLCIAFRENPESPRKDETSTKSPMTTSKPRVAERDPPSDVDFLNVDSTKQFNSNSDSSRKNGMSRKSDPKIFQKDSSTETELPSLKHKRSHSPSKRFTIRSSDFDIALQAAIEASLAESFTKESLKVVQESFAYGRESPWMGMYHERAEEGGDHWQFLPEVQDIRGRPINAPVDPGTAVKITEMRDVYRDGDCGYHVIKLMCLKLNKDCQLKNPDQMRGDIHEYLEDKKHIESIQRLNKNPVDNYMASEAIEAAAKRYGLNIHVVVDTF